MVKSDLDCKIEIIEKIRDIYQDYLDTDIDLELKENKGHPYVELSINGEWENAYGLEKPTPARLIWYIAETLRDEK